jgi:hypothetical protein
MKLSALPALLQPLEGGLFAGVCTTPDGTHHAVVLLPDAPADRLNWADAMAWAESLGEGAQLPSRPVAALLYANAKPQSSSSGTGRTRPTPTTAPTPGTSTSTYGFQPPTTRAMPAEPEPSA